MERVARLARLQLDPVLSMALLAIPVLSLVDFYMTLLILQRGGIEANPLFADLIPTRPVFSFWLKFAMTGFGVTILAATSRYRASRAGAYALPLVYVAIILYEILLLTVIIP